MSIYLARIGIHNFRTFGVFDVELPAAPGLVLLMGTNGLGKSSFFDAIEWGLTGTIRRFAPYLNKGRKRLVESDYLTRRGAEAGSHKVVLTFSDCEPIERSINKATATASIIAKLARSDRRAIEDLSTYLALTHFLGQAAQQRFTSREPQDQWQAIKGPSGLERLAQIRSGLRGRPVVAAFNRRLEQERLSVSTIERQIADWQGWTARLVRLQQAARATGALTPGEVLERTQALEAELDGLLGESANPVSGESTSRRLAALGDRMGDALRNGTARLASFAALDDLPVTYTRVSEEGRIDHPVLVRLRQSASEAQAAVERAAPSLETADKAVVNQTAAIAEIEQEIGLLENVRADIARRDQLAAQIDTAQKDVAEAGTMIAAKRAVFEQADAAINRQGDAAANVARLRQEAETTGGRLKSLPTLMDLEEQSGRLAAALATARDAAAAARRDLDSQIAERTSLEAEIAEAVQARAEAVRHASAISEALAGLASHIHEDDTNCPVCRTPFAPGVLKSLVETAASTSDGQLADADEKLERLRAQHARLATSIDARQSVVDAPIQRERDAGAAANALTDARAALARVLGVDDSADLHAIVHAQARNAAAVLADAVKELEPLAALAAQYAQQRETLATELEDLIMRENQAQGRLDVFRAEDKACVDRIAARGWAESSLERVNQRLTDRREELEIARAQLARLTDAAAATKTALAGLRAELSRAERELAVANSSRNAAEATAREMVTRWTRAGLDGQPSQAVLDKATATLADLVGEFRVLTERQVVLARDNESTLLHAEIVQVEEAMRQAGGESGVADPAAYLAGLLAKADASA
ncbi:DNA repair exonuclease SbcCD ATPase subunit [Bradyrhizobium sp. LM6.11]